MANFKEAKMKTLKWEGGYANVAGDRGGETFAGVAKAFWGNKYPGLFKRLDELKVQAKGNIKEINRLGFSDEKFVSEIENFYKKEFWDVIKGDEINDQSKAEALFDFAVNSGVKTAVKKAQEVCGVSVDGILGNQTLEAINAKDNFTNALCDERTEFFKAAAKRGQNAKFLNGWLNRVKGFYV